LSGSSIKRDALVFADRAGMIRRCSHAAFQQRGAEAASEALLDRLKALLSTAH